MSQNGDGESGYGTTSEYNSEILNIIRGEQERLDAEIANILEIHEICRLGPPPRMSSAQIWSHLLRHYSERRGDIRTILRKLSDQ